MLEGGRSIIADEGAVFNVCSWQLDWPHIILAFFSLLRAVSGLFHCSDFHFFLCSSLTDLSSPLPIQSFTIRNDSISVRTLAHNLLHLAEARRLCATFNVASSREAFAELVYKFDIARPEIEPLVCSLVHGAAIIRRDLVKRSADAMLTKIDCTDFEAFELHDKSPHGDIDIAAVMGVFTTTSYRKVTGLDVHVPSEASQEMHIFAEMQGRA